MEGSGSGRTPLRSIHPCREPVPRTSVVRKQLRPSNSVHCRNDEDVDTLRLKVGRVAE